MALRTNILPQTFYTFWPPTLLSVHVYITIFIVIDPLIESSSKYANSSYSSVGAEAIFGAFGLPCGRDVA